MKAHRFLVGLAVLVVLASGAMAGGAREGKRAGGRKGGRQPALTEYELMVAELNLTDDQKAQLQEKMKVKADALAAWNAAHADKVKAADDAAEKAKTDKTARKEAAEAKKELQAERDKATAAADAAILAVLTPEQRDAWQGVKLYQTLATRYRTLDLTDDQKAKIRSACSAAAKELQAAQSDDSFDRKSKGRATAVTDKLKWAIEVVILTPEQRQSLPQKAARGKKAGAETPAGTN